MDFKGKGREAQRCHAAENHSLRFIPVIRATGDIICSRPDGRHWSTGSGADPGRTEFRCQWESRNR